jgi:hypothetical protein
MCVMSPTAALVPGVPLRLVATFELEGPHWREKSRAPALLTARKLLT